MFLPLNADDQPVQSWIGNEENPYQNMEKKNESNIISLVPSIDSVKASARVYPVERS